MMLPLALFAVTALGGLILALRVFSGGTPPWALSLLHGAFGAAGLVTLYLAIAGTGASQLAWISLGLFVAAALGGFFLASFHLRGKPHPKAIVAVHALVAVTAFAILAGLTFGLV